MTAEDKTLREILEDHREYKRNTPEAISAIQDIITQARLDEIERVEAEQFQGQDGGDEYGIWDYLRDRKIGLKGENDA